MTLVPVVSITRLRVRSWQLLPLFFRVGVWARAGIQNRELVVVGTFLNKIEAEIAQTALEAAEIESMVAADDAGGLRPGLWMSGVKLLVRAEDAEHATKVLKESNRQA